MDSLSVAWNLVSLSVVVVQSTGEPLENDLHVLFQHLDPLPSSSYRVEILSAKVLRLIEILPPAAEIVVVTVLGPAPGITA